MSVAAIEIIEVINRSKQGRTQPFLCRGEDDLLYYVKGRSTGNRDLLCEWFSAHLARALGLPVPEFRIAFAQSSLIDLHPEGRALGTEPAFASAVVGNCQELTVSHIGSVPVLTRRDIFVFDLWIRNQDRTLSTLGGNPNLLWNAKDNAISVIDHNLAFDRDFNRADFAQGHVFSQEMSNITGDMIERRMYEERLTGALSAWEIARACAPQEWWFVDPEQTLPTPFVADELYRSLQMVNDQEFWNLP